MAVPAIDKKKPLKELKVDTVKYSILE